jgi:acyl carrier protein
MSNQDLGNPFTKEKELTVEQRTEEISQWIKLYISRTLIIDVNKIRSEQSFDELGLDSEAAVVMSGDISDLVDVDIKPSVVFEHTTIKDLAIYLTTIEED